jgi:hypothetical protein
MGYTHYWRFHRDKMKTEKLRQTFKKVSEEIQELYKNLSLIPKTGYHTDYPIIIKGGLGEGEPIINESEIWFNGDGELGNDHETFSINWTDSSAFGFCKTARKPYDLLVCMSLLSFTEHFPSHVFTLSSDGDAEEWQDAVDLYNKITDNDIPNPFDKEEVLQAMID